MKTNPVSDKPENGQADEDKPFLAGLTDIKQLKEKAQKAGIKDDNLEGERPDLEG